MDILLQGFVLGTIGGIVPGAVLTILLVSALQGGLRAGIRAFFWAMFSEVTIVGVLLLVMTQLPLDRNVFTAIGFVGSGVLVYMAWSVFKLRAIAVDDGNQRIFTAPKIFLLSMTNAPLYIFWTTICFPLIRQLAVIWNLPIAAISFFVMFEVAWGVTTFALLLIFVFSRKTLTDAHIIHKVFIIVALILVALAVHMFVLMLGV